MAAGPDTPETVFLAERDMSLLPGVTCFPYRELEDPKKYLEYAARILKSLRKKKGAGSLDI